jgi:hypothetical protein
VETVQERAWGPTVVFAEDAGKPAEALLTHGKRGFGGGFDPER